jgi:hypothetical protein
MPVGRSLVDRPLDSLGRAGGLTGGLTADQAAGGGTSVELAGAGTELLRARTAGVGARIDLRTAAARLRHASGLEP